VKKHKWFITKGNMNQCDNCYIVIDDGHATWPAVRDSECVAGRERAELPVEFAAPEVAFANQCTAQKQFMKTFNQLIRYLREREEGGDRS